MPFTQVLGKQRQIDLCEFKDSLVYKVSSRTTKDTQRNPVSKKQKLKNKNKRNRVRKMSHKDGKYTAYGYCMLFSSF